MSHVMSRQAFASFFMTVIDGLAIQPGWGFSQSPDFRGRMRHGGLDRVVVEAGPEFLRGSVSPGSADGAGSGHEEPAARPPALPAALSASRSRLSEASTGFAPATPN